MAPTHEFNFDVEKDIPNLDGKVIFITGGTAGLGKASVETLATHSPAHIYFTGRNVTSAAELVEQVKSKNPSVGLTFLQMDMTSLVSVKEACAKFAHDRLDILMCNAGIMEKPPALSKDGYEIHFAVNHLAHAMVIQQLLSVLLKTAETPESDVRLVSLTSTGWNLHPKGGFTYSTLQTLQDDFWARNARYGQSKLANIMYPAELTRRYPSIKAVSVHPGVVETDLLTSLPPFKRRLICGIVRLQGINILKEDEGRLNQLWAAAGAKKDELVNGAFYMPVGVLSNDKLDKTAKDENIAAELWRWTDDVLAKF